MRGRAAVLDPGFDSNLTSNAALGVSYAGQFGSSLTDQTIRADFWNTGHGGSATLEVGQQRTGAGVLRTVIRP